MAYSSKNPRVTSLVMTDMTTTAGTNPASGTHRLVDRNGQVWVRGSTGTESLVGGGVTTAATAGVTIGDTDGTRIVNCTTAPGNATFSSRSSDTVTFTGAHGAVTGTPIAFNGAGTAPTGLTARRQYYMIVTSTTATKFATSISNALAGTAVTLSGDGSGTRTWDLGIGVVLPAPTANRGRRILVRKGFSGIAGPVAIIPASASDTINSYVGATLALGDEALEVIEAGDVWVSPGGFYSSLVHNGAAIAAGSTGGTYVLLVQRQGHVVNLEVVWTSGSSGNGSTHTGQTGDVPDWGQPSGTVWQTNLTNASDETLETMSVTAAGTVSFTKSTVNTTLTTATNWADSTTRRGQINYFYSR